MIKLTPAQRAQWFARVPNWRYTETRGGAIQRCFEFADFVQAFGFMSQVALVAERANHHPEWSNVYHRVEVLLTTHDAEGVSMRDIDLAREIDRLYDAMVRPL